MIVTLSSNGLNPYQWKSVMKQGIFVKKHSKMALAGAYLNIKREIDIPASSLSYDINNGQYTATIPVAEQTFTDATSFCADLTANLNQDTDVTQVTWKVDFDYGYQGFQLSWESPIEQTISVTFEDDLNSAMGYADETYSGSDKLNSFYSELSVGSLANQNALVIDVSNVSLQGYNAVQGSYLNILGTIPLSNAKSSALNFQAPNLHYIPMRNESDMRLYHLEVNIRYPNGLLCDDLAGNSTIVVSIEE